MSSPTVARTSNAALGRRWFITAMSIGALLFTACSTSDTGESASEGKASSEQAGQTSGEDRLVPPGDPAQTVSRSDVDAALEKVPTEAEALLEQSGLPAMAVTVVFEDEVVLAEGFGVKEAGGDDPVDANTVFQIASLSKPLGATVVAGLVGDGQVAWDDEVIEHLPDFELSDPAVTDMVTIGDFYSHRSGLPDHAGDLLEDLGFDRGYIIDRLRLEPLDPFRNNYAYTNFGLTTGAVAAAAAAGTTWEEATESVLFGPAGMEDSSATLADFLAASNRAIPHERDPEGNYVALEQRDPDPQSPAGGMSSTAADMGTWMRIQLNEGMLGEEQIVDSDALLAMQTPQNLSGPPRSPSAHSSFYGYGLGIGYRDDGFTSWSHSGAFLLGTSTNVVMIPGQQLGVAVTTNGQPAGVPEAMAASVIDLITTGETTKDWLELFGQQFAGFYEPTTPTDWSQPVGDPRPAAEPETYVGTYASDYYGPLEVMNTGDGLVMTLGPQAMEFALEPYDGDTFLFTPPGENSLGPTGIEFEVVDGTAVSVRSEFYDETGLGTWTRV
ncbi:MAG: serine hydrolase [Microthrixaceae bacterium]